jgi:hypothetical protein
MSWRRDREVDGRRFSRALDPLALGHATVTAWALVEQRFRFRINPASPVPEVIN